MRFCGAGWLGAVLLLGLPAAHAQSGPPLLDPAPRPSVAFPRVTDYLQVPPACAPYVKFVLEWTERFAEAAYTSSKEVSRDIAVLLPFMAGEMAEVERTLPRSERRALSALKEFGPDHRCYAPTAAAYLLASVRASDPSGAWARHGLPDAKRARGAQLPGHPGVFLLTAALLKQGKIQILTPGRRRDLGPAWLETRQEKFEVRGAYACASATIYLDPASPPINLVSHLVHELDHLIRDQYSEASGAPWRETLLFDESLALAAGVHRELALGNFRTFGLGPTLRKWTARVLLMEQPLTPPAGKPAYQVPEDRDLYLPGGPFWRLWELAGRPAKAADFLVRTFLAGPAPASPLGPPLARIYSAVNDGYFVDRQPLAQATFEKLLARRTAIGLAGWLAQEAPWSPRVLRPTEPRSAWEISGQFGCIRAPGTGPNDELLGSVVFDHTRADCDPRGQPLPGERVWSATRVELPVPEVLAAVTRLQKKLSEPSPGCQAIVAAAVAGNPDVRSFRGTRLSVDGGPGFPGGEGGTKGDFPVRACFLLNQ